jgi:hypothetical protein
MHIIKKSVGLRLMPLILLAIVILITGSVSATGISIDAGLTPADNRWILRSQYRFMQRDNYPESDAREMRTNMIMVVAAYGIRSDLTIMVLQGLRQNKMTMAGESTSNTGFTDLFILGKYRLARINTPNYTLGIAPSLGLDIPSGNDDFTSNSWDLQMGCLASGRIRSWGIDINTTYLWNGMVTTDGADHDPGDEFSVETALAYQLGFGSEAILALAPVIEFSYRRIFSDTEDGNTLPNTGERVLLLSPGIKVTWGSFIAESLIQLPIWQDQNGLQTERTPSFLIGFRLMS